MDENKTKVLVRDEEGNHNFGENPELMKKLNKEDKESDIIFRILYIGIVIIVIGCIVLYLLNK